ncbi:hypothetical protein ACKKBG_A30590 [Auxenochlorella protothecoides x Auxenochlorella symbiontica]
MYAGPGLPKSLSDMELNLIDEAAKQSGDGETASSLGDTGIDAQHLRSGLPARDDWAEAGPSQPVPQGRFRRLFRWGTRSGGDATGVAGTDFDMKDHSPASADDDDNARLIKSRAPGMLSDDEPLERAGAGLPEGLAAPRGFRQYALGVLRFLLVNWYKFVILGLIIALIVLTAVKGFSIFGDLLRWFQSRNNWGGWGIFLGMYTALVAVFLPGVVFIMGAGFVFGFWKGLLAVWIGGAIGQALAFLLARYLLRDWVEATLRGRWRKWEVLDRAIEHDGWKLVLIMRMSPIIPYNLLNIAMATTSMPFWQFTLVSAVGIIFECGIFCYIGSVASSITSIVSGDAKGSAVEWVLLGLSLVMCVFGAVFVSYSIKSAVRRADEHAAASQHGAGPGAGAGAAGRTASGSRLELDSPPGRRLSGSLTLRSPSPLHDAGRWDVELGASPRVPSAHAFELGAVGPSGSGDLPPVSAPGGRPAPARLQLPGPQASFTLRRDAKAKASPIPPPAAGDDSDDGPPAPFDRRAGRVEGAAPAAADVELQLGGSLAKQRRPSVGAGED